MSNIPQSVEELELVTTAHQLVIAELLAIIYHLAPDDVEALYVKRRDAVNFHRQLPEHPILDLECRALVLARDVVSRGLVLSRDQPHGS